MKIWIIAWRNIWRNKRRSIITISSVSTAIFFALIMRSFQEGTYERAIYNLVHSYTGHLQIHAYGYWDNQILDNTFEYTDSLQKTISSIHGVTKCIKRLDSFTFTSNEQYTKAAIVMSVIPEEDNKQSHIADRIIVGSFISNNDNAVLVSKGLAEYLHIITYDTIIKKLDNTFDTIITPRMLKDSIVLISQGMYGESANGIFKIKGIVKFPHPELNKRTIYMPLKLGQEFFNAQNRLTSLALILSEDDEQESVLKYVKHKLSTKDYEVLTWQDMNPELVQQIQSDKGSGIIMLLVLYLIIGFGIFGTVVMMTAERKREFAIIIALGMRKNRLVIQFLTEMFYMGIIGIIVGIALALPVLFYYLYYPIQFHGEIAKLIEEFGYEAIMPVFFNTQLFIDHSIIVLILFGLTSIYTVFAIKNLEVIKTIHG